MSYIGKSGEVRQDIANKTRAFEIIEFPPVIGELKFEGTYVYGNCRYYKYTCSCGRTGAKQVFAMRIAVEREREGKPVRCRKYCKGAKT